MLSSQFKTVGVAKSSSAINGLVSLDGNHASYDENYEPATTLRVWTGRGYTYYGWTGALSSENPDLLNDLGGTGSEYDNLWFDDNYTEATAELNLGSGFWLYADKAGVATVSGEVLDSNSYETSLVPGLNMLGNPWPCELSLSKISLSNQPSYNTDFDAVVSLRVWNGRGYIEYGWTGNLSTENVDLLDALGGVGTEFDNVWLNSSYEVTEDSIPAGNGFWIFAAQNGVATFTK